MKDELLSLYNRLNKIGIKLEFVGNMPWIYLDKVNGNKVKEKFQANHGFTISWCRNNGDVEISDITEVFKIIRKYRT